MSVAFTLDHDSEAFDSAAEKLLSYEELMEKYLRCEKELNTTNLKLQEFKQAAKKKEFVLHAELGAAHREIAMKYIALYDLYSEYDELMEEHEECKEELQNTTLKLQESEQENEKLKSEAEKKESDLRAAQRETEAKNIALKVDLDESYVEYKELMEVYDECVEELKTKNIALDAIKGVWDESYLEISNLKAMLNDVERSLTTEITKLHTDIKDHIENPTFLESLLKEMEEEEKELISSGILMEDKYRYRVAIGKLKRALEEPNHLHSSKSRFEYELGNAKNIVEELRDSIKELEKQGELQRNAISKMR